MEQRELEEQHQSNPVKEAAANQVKKKGRKLVAKALKKGAKLAAKAAAKGIAVLVKVLLSLAAVIGIPLLIKITIIISLILIVMLVSVFLLGGLGSDSELDGDYRILNEYIIEQANNTVDMSKPEQARYKVPEGLIAAVIQIDGLSEESNISNYKDLIKRMTTSLKPEFTYENFNEYEEIETTVCEDGVCGSPSLEKIDHWVSKLTFADYWNGFTSIQHNPYLTNWTTREEISYRTETHTEMQEVTRTITKTKTEYRLELVKKTRQESYEEWESSPYIDDYGNLACCIYKKVTKYKTVEYYEEELVPYEVEYEEEITVEEEVEVEVTIEIKTIIKTRRQLFNSTENETEDYTTFDNILNSHNMGKKDKQLIDGLYELVGGVSNYTQWLDGYSGGSWGGGFNGNIIPGENVPPQYMPIYLSAEEAFGVDWYVIAALHFVETGYSTHPTMISNMGAVGHFQFLRRTWVGWGFNGTITDTILVSLDHINRHRGFGTDANDDKKADPWDMEDSAHAAARYLAHSGYKTDPRKAIFEYNRADWYVDKVLKKAEEIRVQATYMPDSGMPPVTSGHYMAPTTGPITSGFGERWGTNHNGLDIGRKINGKDRSNVPVVSIGDGKVINSYYSSSYGNCIIIRHNFDGVQYESLYAHLENRSVKTGQEVKKGAFLGYMGNTGYSTGPHLHFELHQPAWENSKRNAFNPLSNNKGIIISIPGS
ncbi:peptidoglycan DD-metalloendopeptidase family protein [Sutcliffiella horikoshii]|uniref:peptidoglycan DD-metalloendopeptidase family protein n=1 Tax=Sutcliffiella horikoshii TaxID=79883 RepID=UPI00203F085A|nr:peptidoglycan DD-metalloendopeptidase family protein [Sutcliffiella horikoshii]MCM3619698.1 peptidoglycan DD-metalloendopeptidase family protein [Sutcliffiella horikoshii]